MTTRRARVRAVRVGGSRCSASAWSPAVIGLVGFIFGGGHPPPPRRCHRGHPVGAAGRRPRPRPGRAAPRDDPCVAAARSPPRRVATASGRAVRPPDRSARCPPASRPPPAPGGARPRRCGPGRRRRRRRRRRPGGPVRVYNNSTISGLAAHAADEFRGDGWTVDAVGQLPRRASSRPARSTSAPGPGRRAPRSDRSEFGLRAEPRFAGLRTPARGDRDRHQRLPEADRPDRRSA